ncbi:MAG TPA: hypothetical protein DDY68_02425 [Porphyromonadaceae bacterium]|nr:hypothetical protein [Porphyromonadaceae bacterium]
MLILFCVISFNLPIEAEKSDEFDRMVTAVPSLSIAPDARAGGMGDAGVSTYPDIQSQHWNPSKYAFADAPAGISINYTPWLRKLVNDINLFYLVGYYKIGNNNNQALSASIRYFSLGKFTMSDETGSLLNVINPYEMCIDLAYSRKLSEYFSGSVAFRYILSDFRSGNDQSIGQAFATDISGYYQKYVILGKNECLFSWGFNISNIGSKVSYDYGTSSNFIPTNLRIGAGLMYPLDNYNFLSIYGDINRLLVPSYPVKKSDESAEVYNSRLQEYYDMSPITGIFKSFGDGGADEFQKLNFSIGLEYEHNHQFFARLGYHYEHPNMGNRRYFTFGIGYILKDVSLDVGYVMASSQNNPLDKTLRFTLAFEFNKLKRGRR